MPKCDFNKVALQLYCNRTFAWVFCKFVACFQNTFSKDQLRTAAYGALKYLVKTIYCFDKTVCDTIQNQYFKKQFSSEHLPL